MNLWATWCIWVFPKIGGKPPKSCHFDRVFQNHYFHHPIPLFLEAAIYVTFIQCLFQLRNLWDLGSGSSCPRTSSPGKIWATRWERMRQLRATTTTTTATTTTILPIYVYYCNYNNYYDYYYNYYDYANAGDWKACNMNIQESNYERNQWRKGRTGRRRKGGGT